MILVFGAGGFIGTYLVDTLISEGFEVIASDKDTAARDYYENKNIEFKLIDITNENKFNQLLGKKIDAVVNVACLQPVNVSKENYKSKDYIYVNVIGTLNILEFCRNNNINKLVYTISHRGVQGLWEKDEIITEQSQKAIKYTGDYAMFSISECAALDCIYHYKAQYGINNIVLRLPPVYGYGPHLEGYSDGEPIKSGFMTFIENAINGKDIEVWGDWTRARDVIYVKDVVNAIILSIRSNMATGLYNISSGSPVSLYDEARAIEQVFSPSEISYKANNKVNKPNNIEQFKYDISRAKKDLQWTPQYNLESMLSDIKKEMESSRFEFLIEKRRKMFEQDKDK